MVLITISCNSNNRFGIISKHCKLYYYLTNKVTFLGSLGRGMLACLDTISRLFGRTPCRRKGGKMSYSLIKSDYWFFWNCCSVLKCVFRYCFNL